MKEIESIKKIIEDRGSDYDAQFGQKLTKKSAKIEENCSAAFRVLIWEFFI